MAVLLWMGAASLMTLLLYWMYFSEISTNGGGGDAPLLEGHTFPDKEILLMRIAEEANLYGV